MLTSVLKVEDTCRLQAKRNRFRPQLWETEPEPEGLKENGSTTDSGSIEERERSRLLLDVEVVFVNLANAIC